VDKSLNDDQTKSRFSFRKGAYQILKIQKKPMSALEILQYGISNNIFNLNGKNRPKTPRNSIAAQLYLDMKKRGNNSWFVKCGPGVFGLKEWKTSKQITD